MKFKKLTPNMMVKDVRESVIFYTEILGFTLNMVVPEGTKTIDHELKDGKNYVYAMVNRDEVYIMLMNKDSFEVDIPMLKGTTIGASVSFYCEVDNINNVYNSIKDKVDIIIDLHTTWYGMQEFYIKDCNDYILAFAGRK